MLYIMNVQINNAEGTSHLKSPIGDCWLDYWSKKYGSTLNSITRYNCPACGEAFLRHEFDGAHVNKIFDPKRLMYIIPLCDSCSHTSDVLSINENLLVLAPQSK